jgi:hypothetical protein
VRAEAYWPVMKMALVKPSSRNTRFGRVVNTGPFHSGAWRPRRRPEVEDLVGPHAQDGRQGQMVMKISIFSAFFGPSRSSSQRPT